MLFLMSVLMLITGAAVGSFVNVLISRSIEGRDWVRGRSSCDFCHKKLEWYDMIPVFSYLLYRGKSRCCKRVLSVRHIFVEALFGTLFVWWLVVGTWFFRLASSPLTILQPSFWLITGILLLIVVVSDFYYQLIPMTAVYLGIGMTFIYRLSLIYFASYRVLDLVISILTGFGVWGLLTMLRVVTRGKGMGEGDPLLAFWLGLVIGFPRAVVFVWSAFIVGGIYGATLLILKRASAKTALPFGPFLAAGFVLSLLFGQFLWNRFWN